MAGDRERGAEGRYGKPSEGGEGGWDWDALLAAWVEDGLDEARFWKQTPRSFAIVLRANAEGQRDRMIILAHQIGAFSRMDAKDFNRGLNYHLKRARRPKRRGDQSDAVAAMFDRMIDKQKAS